MADDELLDDPVLAELEALAHGEDPEAKALAEAIIEWLDSGEEYVPPVDTLALAAERPLWKVDAVDRSADARAAFLHRHARRPLTPAETIEAAWIGVRVVSVAVPGGQTGTLSIGTALAPACEFGSPIRERMAVHRIVLASWERKELSIAVRNGAPAQSFDGVLFTIDVEETRDRTADALGYATLDATTGYHGTVTSTGGGVSAEVEEAA